MSREVKRSERVAVRVHEELAVLLRSLSDPRVLGVVITRVEITEDLSFARIFVRHEEGADAGTQRRLLAGLDSATKRLRGSLTRALALRVAPGIRFLYDTGVDAQTRVEALLQEIAKEPAADE